MFELGPLYQDILKFIRNKRTVYDKWSHGTYFLNLDNDEVLMWFEDMRVFYKNKKDIYLSSELNLFEMERLDIKIRNLK